MLREVLETIRYASNGKSVVREDWEETFPPCTWKGRSGTIWIWNKIRIPKTAWKTACLRGEPNQPFCQARQSKVWRMGIFCVPFWVKQIIAVTGVSTIWGQSGHYRRLTKSFNLVFVSDCFPIRHAVTRIIKKYIWQYWYETATVKLTNNSRDWVTFVALTYFALYFSKAKCKWIRCKNICRIIINSDYYSQSVAWIASKVDFWVSSHLHSFKS